MDRSFPALPTHPHVFSVGLFQMGKRGCARQVITGLILGQHSFSVFWLRRVFWIFIHRGPRQRPRRFLKSFFGDSNELNAAGIENYRVVLVQWGQGLLGPVQSGWFFGGLSVVVFGGFISRGVFRLGAAKVTVGSIRYKHISAHYFQVVSKPFKRFLGQ